MYDQLFTTIKARHAELLASYQEERLLAAGREKLLKAAAKLDVDASQEKELAHGIEHSAVQAQAASSVDDLGFTIFFKKSVF
ncbi:MAG: hypothetical protein OEZ02_11245 [Anaerolineae bacterium]|nr:hypothetical protein [Anaerolineae bacterium]